MKQIKSEIRKGVKVITIEIKDDLERRVGNCIYSFLNESDSFKDNLADNPETGAVLYDDYEEDVGEIADSNTPVHYSNINDLYYLHGNKLDEALKNTGIDAKHRTRKQVAISCYLEQELYSYLSKLEDSFKEWRDENPEAEAVKFLETVEEYK